MTEEIKYIRPNQFTLETGSKDIKFNRTKYQSKSVPFLKNGNLFLPMEDILKELEGECSVKGDTLSYTTEEQDLLITVKENTYYFNEESKNFENGSVPFIDIKGSILVPAKEIMSLLGWNLVIKDGRIDLIKKKPM